MREILHQAMKYLASVCDGANSHDSAGFAKGDSYNGKYLAATPISSWDEDCDALARHYVTKYRKQVAHIIGDMNFTTEKKYGIRERVSEKRRKAYNKRDMPEDKAYIENGRIVTDTSYDANFVADAKKISSRRYGGGRINTFALSDMLAVVALCNKYDVTVDFEETTPVEKVIEETKRVQPKARKEVVIEGGEIAIYFPYSPETVAAVKSLGIARYKKEPTPHWTTEVSNAVKIIEALKPLGFEFESSVENAGQQSIKNKENYAAAATDYSPYVPEIRPEFTVLPHQWVPIEKIVKNKELLDADSQGLGKTFVALTGAVLKGVKRMVVVAPASLTTNWEKESQMFFIEGTFTPYIASGRTPDGIPDGVNLVILSWDVLANWLETLNNWKAELIVVDEAHYGKSGSSSKRGKAFIDLGKKNKNATKVALTGTPILNRPLELLATLIFLGREKDFGGVTKFKNRYCDPTDVLAPPGVKTYKKDSRGRYVITLFNGATNLEELHDKLTATGIYIRRTKKLLIEQGLLGRKYVNGAEFFDYEAKRTPVYIKLTKSELDEYMKIEKEFMDNLELKLEVLAAEMGLHKNHPKVRNAISSNKSGEALMLLNEFRRKIGQLKVRAVKEYIQKLVNKGERVVVFAHHKDVVDAYADAYSGIKIQGGMGNKKIEAVKEKFNARPFEEHPVLPISTEAGKTGHTLCLQRKNGVGQECAYALFAEEPYVYGDAEQAEDRIYRIGQSRDVYIINLIVPDTIDEKIYTIREKKRAVFNAVIDGVSLEDDEEDSIARQLISDYL